MAVWLLLVGSSAACFTDAPPRERSCAVGEAGCDCDAGSCGSGLECIGEIDKCVPIDCDSGSETCTCAAGNACFDPLVCQEGVCLPPAQQGTSDGGSTVTSTTLPSQASSDGSGTAIGSTGGGPDLGDGSTTTSAGTSSTGADPLTCFECVAAQLDADACAAFASACGTMCQTYRSCILEEGDDCCRAADLGGIGQWNDWVMCAAAECDGCDASGLQCP